MRQMSVKMVDTEPLVTPKPGNAPPRTERHEELFLERMLAAMDQHMQGVRAPQQTLVHLVEYACRQALGKSFGTLALVGSVALCAETPGSDVDVVCFTRRDSPDSPGVGSEILRRVRGALLATALENGYGSQLSVDLIDDARVPILRATWGPPSHCIAVDLSIDQQGPLEHVRWFQRAGASPLRGEGPLPDGAPHVTVMLRCIKWWLRLRQMPRTKEGGLPTLVWLLMAVHACSQPEARGQGSGEGRPMADLLASLATFFRMYATPGGCDGMLSFTVDGRSSEFKARPKNGRSPWAELVVLDPTGGEGPSIPSCRRGDGYPVRGCLAPRLSPATQLLLAYELGRASKRLPPPPPTTTQGSPDDAAGRASDLPHLYKLEDLFAPRQLEGGNSLPAYTNGGLGALFLLGNPQAGAGCVEVAVVDHIVPRPGWAASFLHRFDERSELFVRLLDVDPANGWCRFRRKGSMVLCPCHFVCRVELSHEEGRWRALDRDGLERLLDMKQYLVDLCSSQEVDPPQGSN